MLFQFFRFDGELISFSLFYLSGPQSSSSYKTIFHHQIFNLFLSPPPKNIWNTNCFEFHFLRTRNANSAHLFTCPAWNNVYEYVLRSSRSNHAAIQRNDCLHLFACFDAVADSKYFRLQQHKNLCLTMCARKLQMRSLELTFVVWMRSAFTSRDISSSLRRTTIVFIK